MNRRTFLKISGAFGAIIAIPTTIFGRVKKSIYKPCVIGENLLPGDKIVVKILRIGKDPFIISGYAKKDTIKIPIPKKYANNTFDITYMGSIDVQYPEQQILIKDFKINSFKIHNVDKHIIRNNIPKFKKGYTLI